jgi:peroxiredoxin
MAKSRQWGFVGGVVALLAVLLAAGWMVRDRFLPVEVGSGAPGFTATDMEGRPVSLDDLKGQVVLLNVWATWCGPCRDEMPSMERLHRQLGPQGLKIVAVSVDAAPGTQPLKAQPANQPGGGDVAEFAKQLGLTFTIWQDPSGKIQRTYRTTGVPESFVIDRNGVIQKKVIGATEWDAGPHAELLRRLLAERAG